MALDTKEISTLLKEINDSDWNIRLSAVVDMSRVRRTSSELGLVVEALTNAINDKNEYVRRDAAMALGNFGNDSLPAINTLEKYIEDEDYLMRQSIIYTLGKIGPGCISLLDKMAKMLEDPEEKISAAAPWALSMVCREEPTKLVPYFNSPSKVIKSGSIQAAGKMGPQGLLIADELITLLKDPEFEVRYQAAKALGNLREAYNSVPILIELLQDSDVDVRWAASEALMKIGTEEAMTAWASYQPRSSTKDLIKQLKNPNRLTRENAAKALKDLGKNAKEALHQLIDALRDQMSFKVRAYAAEALGRIGIEAEPAIPALLKLLEDKEDPSVPRAAAQSLGKIGAEAMSAVPKLVEHLKNPSKDVAKSAAMALQRISTPDAIEALKGFKWD